MGSGLASLSIILVVLWTVLAYITIPLPVGDPIFAWLRRQWLQEGIALLAFCGVCCLALGSWRTPRVTSPGIPWSTAWWVWILWAGVSSLASIDRGTSLRSWLALASYGLLGQGVCSLVKSSRDVVLWTRFLVGVAVVVSLEGLLQYVGSFAATLPLLDHLQATGQLDLEGWGGEVIKDFLIRKRIVSVFGWPNLFAGFLLLMIPPAVGLSASARTTLERVGWGMASGLLGLCLILTLSMGGWIAAILTGCVAWWLMSSSPRRASRARLGVRGRLSRVLLVGVAVVGIVCVASFILAKRARPLIIASVSSRFVYVQGAWNILQAHPMKGTGLGTFGLAYQALKPQEAVEGQHTALHAHNTLLEVGAELGLMGVLLFMAFIWRVGGVMVHSVRHEVASREAALQQGLGIGVVGFFLHSLLEQTFFEAVTAPFWWLTVGLLTAAAAVTSSDTPRARGASARVTVVLLPLVAASLGLLASLRVSAADLWGARGALLQGTGESQDAVKAFAKAQRWDPLASRYALAQGEFALKRLQPQQAHEAARPLLEQAQRHYERAAALSPWLGYAWLRLGLVRWQLGQVDTAIAATREAVQKDPNSRAALAQLIQMLSATGRFDEAQHAARQFQRLEPSSPEGFAWEALAWQGRGERPQAIATYRQVVRRFPDHFPALFNLAELLRAAGALDEAAGMYEAFLRAAPSSEPAQRARAEAFLKERAEAGSQVTSR